MNSKLKCIILDDEIPGLTYLRMLCEQFPFIEVERCFSSPETFLKEKDKLSFDICLLDINMPNISGIEVAQMLKDKIIIFTSAHPEFAVTAYELEAFDFIKKPVTKDRLEKTLQKAQKHLTENKTEKNFFSWNTNIGKSTIYFDEILFITTSEIDKRDKLIYLNNNNQFILKNITLDKLMELLPKKNFIQVNKSDIISKGIVQAHTADEIILKTKIPDAKDSITIGDSFKKSFVAWLG